MKYVMPILLICLVSSCTKQVEHKTPAPENRKTEIIQEKKPKKVKSLKKDYSALSKQLEGKPGREPHPELPWHHNAAIYEINTRQFSDEGTFAKVEEQISRLSSLGIKVLWFMPIQPIGEKNRKGRLGSPYSIANYTAVNPALGSMADFKSVVNTAHARGMKVILDWVANHTAFDHVWAADNLDYYTLKDGKQIVPKDEVGNTTDWTDVAELNFDNKEMRADMIEDMKFWVRECNIDGFRCDMAGYVPLNFWEEAVLALASEKEGLFWLAEWDDPKMHRVFQMTYGWEPYHIMNDVARGKVGTEKIAEYLEKESSKFPDDAYRMYFTTNHDENAFNGTVAERMGKNGDAMTVLAFTLTGMPLLYNGQEAGLNKRLAFFDKDEISWTNKKKAKLFQKLMVIKQTNKALWNGIFGGRPKVLFANGKQFGFIREKGPDVIMVLTNFDDKPAEVTIDINKSLMTDIFSRKGFNFSTPQKVKIPAHGYMLFQ